ncbi:hypothetical protein [Amycolatopsis sp. cmx-11-51]|uniref:hypothetical protein n=1 Tax=Amycolatopsis sp. cmx-11-51 TaxID=2785797 RepID=UPI0039E36A53
MSVLQAEGRVLTGLLVVGGALLDFALLAALLPGWRMSAALYGQSEVLGARAFHPDFCAAPRRGFEVQRHGRGVDGQVTLLSRSSVTLRRA